jgi:hypothetical protein
MHRACSHLVLVHGTPECAAAFDVKFGREFVAPVRAIQLLAAYMQRCYLPIAPKRL